MDIFEAVDDDVTKTKWAESTDTFQLSDTNYGYNTNKDFPNFWPSSQELCYQPQRRYLKETEDSYKNICKVWVIFLFLYCDHDWSISSNKGLCCHGHDIVGGLYNDEDLYRQFCVNPVVEASKSRSNLLREAL